MASAERSALLRKRMGFPGRCPGLISLDPFRVATQASMTDGLSGTAAGITRMGSLRRRGDKAQDTQIRIGKACG
jgi:hypothetical protein